MARSRSPRRNNKLYQKKLSPRSVRRSTTARQGRGLSAVSPRRETASSLISRLSSSSVSFAKSSRVKSYRPYEPFDVIERSPDVRPVRRDALTLIKDAVHSAICKERPKGRHKKNKGSGASRSFIPWCSRKK